VHPGFYAQPIDLLAVANFDLLAVAAFDQGSA
jgi:hypothetical protein